MTAGWWCLCVGQAAAAGWLLAGPSPVARRLARVRNRSAGSGAPRPATLGRLRLGRLPAGLPADDRRGALGDLLAALAAELRTGAAPRDVLARAAASAGLVEVAAAARHPAGAPAAALEAVAAEPGGSAAADLAVLWRVSELTGCSLVEPVSRLLVGHRGEDRLRRQVSAALAGPRSTARLLALLPLAGFGLGLTLGADPAGFLLGSPAGVGCLVGAAALVGVGTAWSRAVVRSALPSSGGDRITIGTGRRRGPVP